MVELQTPEEYRCSVCVGKYKGWNTLHLKNGLIHSIVAPEIGGRIIQLGLGSDELFYVNPRHAGNVYSSEENNLAATWKNYGGSKVWPAPQGWTGDQEWPGPPDPILDGGTYTCNISEKKPAKTSVRLESPYDEYTGLTIRRQIQIERGSSITRIFHTFRNASLRRVRWAIWQVTQLSANPKFKLFFPATGLRQILGDEPYRSIENHPDRGLQQISYADQVAKFAVHATDGWLLALDSQAGIVFSESFRIFSGSRYPNDTAIEIWINGRGTFTVHGDQVSTDKDPNGSDCYVETEVLSPIIDLDPGQEYSIESLWRCAKVNGENFHSVCDCGVVTRPIEPVLRGNQVRVSGSVGVFFAGLLELVPVHRNGRAETPISLGPATPLQAVEIDSVFPYEPGLSHVSLRLRNPENQLLGTISHGHIR